MSFNAEALSDDGYLGSPYRAARVFGAAVPERNPRTRSARALMFAPEGRPRLARRAAAPTTATTGTPGRSRATPWSSATAATSGKRWLADAYVRYYTQDKALFYSDNAQSETTYVSRNRQL